jgi:hypothetical protein
MLPATGTAPHNFSFRRVQLKTVAAHAAGDVINAIQQLWLQLRDHRRLGRAIDLDIVGVEMRAQAVMFDHSLKVRRIQQEQNRSKYRTLRYSAEDPTDRRVMGSKSHMLYSILQVGLESGQCQITDSKRYPQSLKEDLVVHRVEGGGEVKYV